MNYCSVVTILGMSEESNASAVCNLKDELTSGFDQITCFIVMLS